MILRTLLGDKLKDEMASYAPIARHLRSSMASLRPAGVDVSGGVNRLSVAPLSDSGTVDRILADPWIAAKIGHDDRPPGHIDHPAVSYHGAWVDGTLQGIFTALRTTSCDADVHAAILKPALIHGRALGRLFIAAMFDDPKLLRLTAHVLATLPSAVNYCRRLGFEVEGYRPDACLQKTRAVGVWALGLRRATWAETDP